MKKLIIAILLLALPAALLADQGSVRNRKKFNVALGGAALRDTGMLSAQLAVNLNAYFSLGVDIASGTIHRKDTGVQITPFGVGGPYTVTDHQLDRNSDYGFLLARVAIYPFKSLPLYVAALGGRDTGRQTDITQVEYSFASLSSPVRRSLTLAQLHERPDFLYGLSAGARYYFDNGFFLDFEVGALYQKAPVQDATVQYSENTFFTTVGNPVEDYLRAQAAQDTIKSLYGQNDRRIHTIYSFKIGVAI